MLDDAEIPESTRDNYRAAYLKTVGRGAQAGEFYALLEFLHGAKKVAKKKVAKKKAAAKMVRDAEEKTA
jgi:hypothetical protein